MPKAKINYTETISVIMPTYKRPGDLPRALGSVLTQQGVSLPVEIVVADNDPLASAKATVERLAKGAAFTIHYLHVPSPGVSNARNAAIAQAKGRYIAWLDDDQEAAPNWLAALLASSQAHGAGLVFCPSPPRMEKSTALDAQYEAFYARKAPEKDGLISKFYGCGNSLMDRARVTLPDPIFDPIANETGGEDDMLFSFIQDHGALTAWTSETFVYEHVPASRATPKYVRQRSFAWGQGPTEIARDRGDWIGVLRWMVIGAGQVAVYGPITLVHKLGGHPRYIHWLGKTWQGLGKLFWYRGFRPRLYGAAGAANKAAADARLAKRPAQS